MKKISGLKALLDKHSIITSIIICILLINRKNSQCKNKIVIFTIYLVIIVC